MLPPTRTGQVKGYPPKQNGKKPPAVQMDDTGPGATNGTIQKLSGNDGTGLRDGYRETAPVGQFPQGASPLRGTRHGGESLGVGGRLV